MKYKNMSLGQVEAIINKLGAEEGVQRFLSKEFKLVPVVVMAIYRVVVNYSQSLADMIAAGQYDFVQDSLNAKEFRIGCGPQHVDIELLSFERRFDMRHEVLKEIDRLGYRSVNLAEFLTLCALRPLQQHIVALYTPCYDCDEYCVCFDQGADRRKLYTLWYRELYYGSPNNYYAVVRK